MPRRVRYLLLALPALAAAGCSMTSGSDRPAPTVTVTATVTATPTPTEAPEPVPDPADPLAALAPLREAFLLEDTACRGGPGDLDGTENACDARHHVALAWERTAMGAYERAYRARDESTLLALAGPEGQEQVETLLATVAHPDEPMLCEIVHLTDDDDGMWECMLWPDQEPPEDGSGGWGFVLAGDLEEDLPVPELYVRQAERDLG